MFNHVIVVRVGTSSNSLDRDLVLYDRKALQYLSNMALKASQTKDSNGNSGESSQAPTLLTATDPIDYWKEQVKYKIFLDSRSITDHIYAQGSQDYSSGLASFALDLLCCPATSCASERVFSAAGYLCQNRSSSIGPAMLEARVIVKTNSHVDID